MQIQEGKFFNRDLSWLQFNQRVLLQAKRKDVPLLEKVNFLAIYSSNLDEFFRVRIPLLQGWKALHKKKQACLAGADAEGKGRQQDLGPAKKYVSVYSQAKARIKKQQELFGKILNGQIIPMLETKGMHLMYNKPIPDFAFSQLRVYYHEHLSSFIHSTMIEKGSSFFPLNNELYFLITTKGERAARYICNIPSGELKRFKVIEHQGQRYIFFIDDIIRAFFLESNATTYGDQPQEQIEGFYSFKVTRDAELNFHEQAGKDFTAELQRELARRDYGIATRILYDPDMPPGHFKALLKYLNLKRVNAIKGGRYHNLKDFFSFPSQKGDEQLRYSPHEYASHPMQNMLASGEPFFQQLERGDQLIHTPYQSYDLVLRFFNQAAQDKHVKKIYITLYRLAKDSKIGHALLNAARNGKKVFVFVELKARFDEQNNISWAKKLQNAGVRISYSIPKIKVHAKVALVQRQTPEAGSRLYGLFSTGNMNENTARIYTDHSLLSADQSMLQELQGLFGVLKSSKDGLVKDGLDRFSELLVAGFNLKERFMALLDFEIDQARMGKKAYVRIKLNNLEEESLIQKLYEASGAGVSVELIVRGICRLIPQRQGLSENIVVKRIVGRYLEHSRIFEFYHGGKELMYAGSADWMNRNIYHRIEVCFPIKLSSHKKQIQRYLDLQWQDDISSSYISAKGQDKAAKLTHRLDSQQAIAEYLSTLC